MPRIIDVTGREPSTATLALRGAIALGVIVVLVAALLLQYRGAFRTSFGVTAVLAGVGDGLLPGADVKLRGVLVGRVAEVAVRPGADGGPDTVYPVRLDLDPEHAADIPAAVRARVIPTNLFATPAVELVTDGPPRPTLAPGARIPADTSAEAVRLQSVLTRLRDVLVAVQPAKLNAALTGISQALDGRGDQIGSVIGRLDAYLRTLNRNADDFSADLGLLADSLEGLAANAPALLDTVDNVVVITRTIVDKRQQLVDTLTVGTRAADTVDGLLGENIDQIVEVLANGQVFISTIARDSDDIPRSLQGAGRGAAAVAVGLDPDGGGLSLTIRLSPFTPYTAADCPRYPGLAGPNCNAAAGDGPPPDTGAAGELLLGPILRGSTVVVPR